MISQPKRSDYATQAEYSKAWRAANRDDELARRRNRHAEIRDSVNERRRLQYAVNPILNRERSKEYYHTHKDWSNARTMARRKAKNQASLRGLPGEHEIVLEFYREARRKTEETGVQYVVDHIYPLNGERSCGLHVSWNMQVITGAENDSKGNKEPF